MPPTVAYQPHNQLYHHQVTNNGYGITFAASQPSQAAAQTPEKPSTPTTPGGSTLRKGASPFTPKSNNPTVQPVPTPPSKRSPSAKQSAEGTLAAREAPVRERSLPPRNAESPKYSVELLVQLRDQYTQAPDDLVRSLKGRVKFDFASLLPVEDLDKSNESWRAQVEDLKKSNPLVTKLRRMLNK